MWTIGIKNGATEIDPDMHRRQFKTSYTKRSFKHAGLYKAAK